MIIANPERRKARINGTGVHKLVVSFVAAWALLGCASVQSAKPIDAPFVPVYEVNFPDPFIVPSGEAQKFLTEAQLLAKFDGLAGPVLGGERANALARAQLNIDRAESLSQVFGPATRA